MKSTNPTLLPVAIAILAAFATPLTAAENSSVPQAKREAIEWTDVWIPGADKSEKPRVLLVGDSVTKGYYNNVAKSLSADAHVARLATSLCVCDPAFIPILEAVLMQAQFGVIHFNNGLHGIGYTEEEYENGYRAAIQAIRKIQPRAKIIVALSTPLKKAGDKRKFNPRIGERNRIAAKIAKETGSPVDDLHTPLLDRPELHRDTYHFNKNGIAIQVEQVVRSIRKLLE